MYPLFPFIPGENIDETEMCTPETARGLMWNWTKVGEVHVQPCPGGASGLARWSCVSGSNGSPRRSSPTPDLSECRSVWLTTLNTRIAEGDSIINIANELSQVSNRIITKAIRTVSFNTFVLGI